MSRPSCHGDEDAFDPQDIICEECDYSQSCTVVINRNRKKEQEERKERTTSRYRDFRRSPPKMPSRNYNSVSRKPSPVKHEIEIIEEEASEDDTYMSVLAHNAGIEAIQAMFDELASSVRHIPRKTYTNVWRRKKKWNMKT